MFSRFLDTGAAGSDDLRDKKSTHLRREFDDLFSFNDMVNRIGSANIDELDGFGKIIVRELEKFHPLIALQSAISEIIGRQRGARGLVLGHVKIAYPSLKSLNDDYFGSQEKTNEFLRVVRRITMEQLAPWAENLDFNGPDGLFLLNVKDVNGAGVEQKFNDERFKKNISAMLSRVTLELINMLKEEIRLIDGLPQDKKVKEEARLKNLKSLYGKLMTSDSPGLERETTKEDTLKTLEIDSMVEQEDEESSLKIAPADYTPINNQAHVSIGLVPLKDVLSKRSLMLSLFHSSIASSMNARRTFKLVNENESVGEDSMKYKNGERAIYQEFKHEYFYKDIVRAREEIEREVLGGGTDIMPQWKDIFHFNENGELRMKIEAIAQFRKQRVKGDFTAPFDVEDVRKVFEAYYVSVNYFDFPKPFIKPEFADFLSHIDSMNDAVRDIKTPHVDDLDLNEALDYKRQCLLHGLSLLKFCPKRVMAGKVISSTRGAVDAIIADEKALIRVDHIGIGALNIQEFEDLAVKMKDEVSVKNAESFTKEEKSKIDDIILLAGDRVTNVLRQFETACERIVRGFAPDAVIKIIPFGDEVNVLISGDISAENIERILESLCRSSKVRAVGVKVKGGESVSDRIRGYLNASKVSDEELGRLKGSGSDFSVVEI